MQLLFKDRSNPGYWVNGLLKANIIQNIEKAKAKSSWGGMFSAVAGAAFGSDLQGQLKAAYKKGTESFDEEDEGQLEYINIVLKYFTEHQENDSLAKFAFEEPEKLYSTEVRATASAGL